MKGIKDKLIEAVGCSSFITVSSDKNVVIEGCKQILDCTDILVRVRTVQFTIEIWGTGLTLSSYSNSCVEVEGRISSISLEKHRKGDVN